MGDSVALRYLTNRNVMIGAVTFVAVLPVASIKKVRWPTTFCVPPSSILKTQFVTVDVSETMSAHAGSDNCLWSGIVT